MDRLQNARNDRLVRSYLSAFASGEPSQVASHVTDGFVNQHFGKLGGGCETKAAYLERLAGFLASFENLAYAPQSVCCTQDEGCARYMMTFTQDGKAFEVPGMMWFEFEDGKIARRIDCWDSLVYLTQAGADADAIAKLL